MCISVGHINTKMHSQLLLQTHINFRVLCSVVWGIIWHYVHYIFYHTFKPFTYIFPLHFFHRLTQTSVLAEWYHSWRLGRPILGYYWWRFCGIETWRGYSVGRQHLQADTRDAAMDTELHSDLCLKLYFSWRWMLEICTLICMLFDQSCQLICGQRDCTRPATSMPDPLTPEKTAMKWRFFIFIFVKKHIFLAHTCMTFLMIFLVPEIHTLYLFIDSPTCNADGSGVYMHLMTLL